MKRHPLDPWSLVFGIGFVGLGAAFLNTHIDIADLSGIWLLPIPLLFGGLLLLGFGLGRMRQPAWTSDAMSPASPDEEPAHSLASEENESSER